MNPSNNPPPPDEESQAGTSLSGSGAARDFQSAIQGSNSKDFQPYVSGSSAQQAADEAGKLQPGALLGEYEIISLLGVGGMGFVYKARHRILNKIYALKTLNYEKVNETAWRRLQLEAQAIARMNHPNIIAIHNLGLHDGVLPFYVMDLLEGENLADVLARDGALSFDDALMIFIGVASGLSYAHKKGIIHRDIKPGNIFLLKAKDATGSRVKLVDFGIAKLSGVDAEIQNLTTAGEIFGSPYYMSPEHCDGKRIDARSDIYSLGCTFFEVLTGLPPFRGANSIQTMMMHQSQSPPRLSKATGGKVFPEAMEEMIATMLEKAPVDRYQNLEEVVADLQFMQEEAVATRSSQASSSARQLGQTAVADGQGLGKHPIQFALKILLAVAVLLSAVFTFTYWLKLESEKSSFDVKTTNPTTNPSAPASVPGAETAPITAAGNIAVPVSVSSHGEAVVAQVNPYFVETIDDHGVLKSKFDFGAANDLGSFEVEGQEQWIPAKGVLLLPPGAEITLHCNAGTMANPALLDGFGPSDLFGLVFDGRFRLSAKALPHVLRLGGLQRLSIFKPAFDLDRESLGLLSGLSQIRELELVGTGLSGSDLATYSRIKKLKHLTYSPLTEPSVLLAALTPSKNLTELTLEQGPLTLSDFKAIATCSNLRHLRLNNTRLTNEGMAELASLVNLKQLEARESLLDRNCLTSLKKLHKLKELLVGGPNMGASETVEFSNALGIPVH